MKSHRHKFLPNTIVSRLPEIAYSLIESDSFVMGKRKQPDLDLDPVFDKFFAAANASDDKDAIVKFLKAIKFNWNPPLLNPTSPPYPDSLRFHWNIKTLPDVKEMQPSACLCSVFPDLIDPY